MNSQQTSPRSAFSSQTDSVQAASEIVQKLAAGGTAQPRCVVFFAGLAQDRAAIGGALQAQFPSTQVIGCSANGEFSDGHYGKGGVAALALYESVGFRHAPRPRSASHYVRSDVYMVYEPDAAGKPATTPRRRAGRRGLVRKRG